MGKFNAASVVEPLDYDFTHFKAGKGTITEPTDNQIRLFGVAQVMLQRQVVQAVPDTDDDASLDEKLAAIEKAGSAQALVDYANTEAAMYADLCSGKPSGPELLKLPPRVRNAFYTWLRGEISPEAEAGGGTAGD
jgi:hypothetical protein